ncbi:hypothetical protein SAMN05428950_101123 [Sphingomonas sp. OV641]|uniref:hypothetical protein n=1 Tax=unclassified Sphingomonas TaxID=196159 RepID=UPI00083508B8|nr:MULTISPECIES: hypothetical protein [unclassified Sphingomonas]SEI75587.1 hypothetical protein SAMN05428950_101123 [Sphingomonas sp. OV641]
MIAPATERAAIWRRRSDNALRFVAAVPLGYAVASLWAAALARLLPMARSEATVTGTLVALLLCALFAMYAYGARSGWRALWVLAVAGGVAGGLVWWSIATMGRA